MKTELDPMYRRQSAWFAGERNRLLRRAGIARADAVLDLGSGTGSVLPALDRRARGFAVGLDRDEGVLRDSPGLCVAGAGASLPFRSGVFDIVFCQMFFLWVSDLDAVLCEIGRVLVSGGYLVCSAEPDYGGAIEHPDQGRVRMLARKLEAQGALTFAPRVLPGAMKERGFVVECGSHASRPVEAATPGSRFAVPELLRESSVCEFLHIPYFWFLGRLQ